MSFVSFQGIISRPILNVPMSREEVIAELRAALSHRITWGTWGADEDEEGGDE